MKVIGRQNGLVVKLNRNFVSFILSRARSIRSKVHLIFQEASWIDVAVSSIPKASITIVSKDVSRL